MSGDYEFCLSKARLGVLLACLGVSAILLFCAGMITGLLIRKGAAIIPANAPLEKPMPRIQPATAPTDAIPPPAVPPAPPPGKAAVKSGLLVQVASFRAKVRADNLAESLRRQGFAPVSVASAAVDQETWHVVRIGPYPDWDSAAQAAASIDKAFSVRTRLLASDAASN